MFEELMEDVPINREASNVEQIQVLLLLRWFKTSVLHCIKCSKILGIFRNLKNSVYRLERHETFEIIQMLLQYILFYVFINSNRERIALRNES